MNRRQFNIRLTALGLAPLAPSLASARAAAPLSATATRHYPWALQYARVHGTCSPRRLAKALNLSPDVAAQLFSKLQANGIVSAPGLTGIARAAKPIDWNLQRAASPLQTARGALSRKLRDTLRETGSAEPDKQTLKEARKTESERSPEAQSTGSTESPPA